MKPFAATYVYGYFRRIAGKFSQEVYVSFLNRRPLSVDIPPRAFSLISPQARGGIARAALMKRARARCAPAAWFLVRPLATAHSSAPHRLRCVRGRQIEPPPALPDSDDDRNCDQPVYDTRAKKCLFARHDEPPTLFAHISATKIHSFKTDSLSCCYYLFHSSSSCCARGVGRPSRLFLFVTSRYSTSHSSPFEVAQRASVSRSFCNSIRGTAYPHEVCTR